MAEEQTIEWLRRVLDDAHAEHKRIEESIIVRASQRATIPADRQTYAIGMAGMAVATG